MCGFNNWAFVLAFNRKPRTTATTTKWVELSSTPKAMVLLKVFNDCSVAFGCLVALVLEIRVRLVDGTKSTSFVHGLVGCALALSKKRHDT